MKIEKTPLLKNNMLMSVQNTKQVQSVSVESYDSNSQILPGHEVPFGAIYGVVPPKDTLAKKMKLVKKIEDMLAERRKYSSDVVFNELRKKSEKDWKRYISRILNQEYSKNEVRSTIFESDNPEETMTTFIAEFFRSHEKEIVARIEKLTIETEKIVSHRAEQDQTNYELLNRLHSTIINDDINLLAAYRKYYGKLNSITKIEEVKTNYPKINIPPSPENVSAKKIINILPKSFFMEFDRIKTEVSPKEAKIFLQEQFTAILQDIAKESGVSPDFLSDKLRKSLFGTFIRTYNEVKSGHGFASYPETRKIKRPILSKTDVELLDIDYNKFVIETLRKTYLEGKKLSDIEYSEGKHLIKLGTLASTDYKFPKEDVQIKKLLRMADEIKAEETKYEAFDIEQFKARIKYFFNHEFENEKILDRLLDFDSAQFVEGDRQPLIKFLRVLDDLCDMKITEKEAEEIIEKENLRPHGTDLINEAQREAYRQSILAEQEVAAEFNKYCGKFDNAVDRLFAANLEEAASLCISYKPGNAKASRQSSDKVIQIISEFTDKDGRIVDTSKLEQSLKHWNTYMNYKLYDAENPVLQKAIKFATNSEGSIDEIKAGQYLENAKIVAEYPTGVAGTYSKDEINVISAIMAKSKTHDDKVLKLIDYENYKLLPERERLQITTILKTFDINSSVDKSIVEALVKDIYVKTPTHITTKLNKEQTLTKDSVMMPSAKIDILEDKQFPGCLKYFETFERFMTRAAQSKEEDGIQIVGTNNKALRKLYKQEVKVPMEERLFSTKGDYVFDVYRPGLHRAKSTKA